MNDENIKLPTVPLLLKTTHSVESICGWPTDLASIDYYHYNVSNNNNNNTTSINTIPASSLNDSQTNDFTTLNNNYYKMCYPHTIIMFIPGNPGCIGWYVNNLLYQLLQTLGVGYAVRAASYAGHGVGTNIVGGRGDETSTTTTTSSRLRDYEIPWTIDGQVIHKIHWIDLIFKEMTQLHNRHYSNTIANSHTTYQQQSKPCHHHHPKFIFITHSIGAHLLQRVCLLRKHDILLQTKLIIHLMPFFRFDPSSTNPIRQFCLSTVASTYHTNAIQFIQTFANISRSIPKFILNWYLHHVTKMGDSSMESNRDRKLAMDLMIQPEYAKNFLTLGLEEIRNVPEIHDLSSLRLVSGGGGDAIGDDDVTRIVPISILYCGGPDFWAPPQHMKDIEECQRLNILPGKERINVTYDERIIHDFIVHPEMISPVMDFILSTMKKFHVRKNAMDENDKHTNSCDDGFTIKTTYLIKSKL